MVVHTNLQVVMMPQVALSLPHVSNLNLQVSLQFPRLAHQPLDAVVFDHFVLVINLLLKLFTRVLLTVRR